MGVGAHRSGVPRETRLVGAACSVVVMRGVGGPRAAQPGRVEAGGGVVQGGVEHVRRLEGAARRRQQAERQVAGLGLGLGLGLGGVRFRVGLGLGLG